jgi:hypothetical protein
VGSDDLVEGGACGPSGPVPRQGNATRRHGPPGEHTRRRFPPRRTRRCRARTRSRDSGRHVGRHAVGG